MTFNKLWTMVLLPITALAVLVIAVSVAPGYLQSFLTSPVLEELTVERVRVTEDGFVAKVRADGPEPIVIAQVMVDGAFWVFTQSPAEPLERMRSAWISIDFPWVADEVHHLRFVTAQGTTFDHTIDVALKTPTPSQALTLRYGLLGILVGLVPVAFGMVFYPALKAMGRAGMEFVLALTIGLLVYLFFDMVLEGLEIASNASPVFGGGLLVLLPMMITLAALLSIRHGPKREPTGLQVAILISFGIGLHNFGEGLAIGASFSTNEAALGAFLILGFTLHNTTEGIGIVSPLLRQRVTLGWFAALALLAGLPAVPGIWIGAFAFSSQWAALFFGIGAGAVVQVIIEIDRYMQSRVRGPIDYSRFSGTSVAGYALGIALMYSTALIIAI